MIYIRMAVFEAGICPERTIPARMAELAATLSLPSTSQSVLVPSPPAGRDDQT
jgi:hypothetical protein